MTAEKSNHKQFKQLKARNVVVVGNLRSETKGSRGEFSAVIARLMSKCL